MSNKTNYLKAVRENVTVEFQEYREAELKKSKEEIFNDNYKIRFYTELADFFECSPENNGYVTERRSKKKKRQSL